MYNLKDRYKHFQKNPKQIQEQNCRRLISAHGNMVQATLTRPSLTESASWTLTYILRAVIYSNIFVIFLIPLWALDLFYVSCLLFWFVQKENKINISKYIQFVSITSQLSLWLKKIYIYISHKANQLYMTKWSMMVPHSVVCVRNK